MNKINLNRNKSDENLKSQKLISSNLKTHQMSKSNEELKKNNDYEKELTKSFYSQEEASKNNSIKFIHNEKEISSLQSNQSFTCSKQKILVNGDHDSISKPDINENKDRKISLDKVEEINNKNETYTDFGGIDLEEFLFNILQKNLKDRIHLLKIEQELINLIKNDQKKSHKFPPMSSYHRMLVHRVAAYFGLEHIIDNNGNCVIVIKQKGFTRIPELKFKDHIKEITSDEPKKLILKRDTSCLDDNYSNDSLNDKKSNNLNNIFDSRRSKSFEEREEQYEKVRARIFNQSNVDEFKEKENSQDFIKSKENSNNQKCNSNKFHNQNFNLNNCDKKYELLNSKNNFESGPFWNNIECEKQNSSDNHKHKKIGNSLDTDPTIYFTASSFSSNSNSFLNSDNEFVEQVIDKKVSKQTNNLDIEEDTIKTSTLKLSKNVSNYSLPQSNLINNQNLVKSKISKQNSKTIKTFNKNSHPLFVQNNSQQSVFNTLDKDPQRYKNWIPNSDLQDSIYQRSMPYGNYLSQQNQQKTVLVYSFSENNNVFGNEKVVSPSQILQSSNINQNQVNNRNTKNNSFGKENVNGILTAPLSALSITSLNPKINDVNPISGIPVCYLKPLYYPNTGTNTLPGDVLFSNRLPPAQISNQSQPGQMIMIQDYNTHVTNFTQPNTLIPNSSINLLNNQTFVPPSNFGYSVNGASTSHLELNSVYPQINNSYVLQNSGMWPQQSPLLPTPLVSSRIQKPNSSYMNNLAKHKKKVTNDKQINDLLKIDETKKKLNTNKILMKNIGSNLNNNKPFRNQVFINEPKLISNT